MEDGERQTGRHACGDHLQRDTCRSVQEPRLSSPAAPMRTILPLRAVRDLSAGIMAFGMWSVQANR
jgi:hypothetical protein